MSYLSASWNIIGLNKLWLGFVIPAAFGYVGYKIDMSEKDRSTSWRDKSALFGGRRKPGEPPSW